jgi:enoyl-CoA hydratase
MSTTLELVHAGDPGLPVAILRMDDGKANAFNPTMLASFSASLDAAERSEAKALVIVGRPGFYSGGLDLKALPALSTADKARVLRLYGEVLLRVFTFRTPTVTALTGHAIAGGALMALATDVRVAVDNAARFGITEVAIGLPVPTFGLLAARAAMAPHVLTEMVLQARAIMLRDALPRGIVRSLHPEDGVVDAAIALGGELAKLPGAAHQHTKRGLWAADIERIVEGMDAEIHTFVELFEQRFPPAS